MKNVTFLQTSAGTYGVAHTGDELTLKDSVASHLEKNGVVEITGDAGEDAEESVAHKGSVRITHEEAGGGAPAGETDENNPTGPDKKVTKKVAPPRGAKKTSKK